jgi:GTP-binding protein HflX
MRRAPRARTRAGALPPRRPREVSPIYEVKALEERKERAVLVGLSPSPTEEDSLVELALLARTAGAEVAHSLYQRREAVRAGTFLSRGKLEELHEVTSSEEVDLVIFDDDLSPAQVRTLENRLETKIIDRSELILAIFAEHARTRESRLQVELAQLEYLLPRLTRMWGHLSRQQGGIGTRGPGETQLEVDRRRVREKIAFLKRKLKDVDHERRVQRARRNGVHKSALVGYTNAGKSTLMNALTRAGVRTEDAPFATLDATTRRYRFPEGQVTLFTDTVGFIRKLPHHLVASFRSTLQEVVEADLLLHVVDAASPAAEEQIEVVDRVLEELGVSAKPSLLVLNKVDAADEVQVMGLRARHPGALVVSALDRDGLDPLRRAVRDSIIAGNGRFSAPAFPG